MTKPSIRITLAVSNLMGFLAVIVVNSLAETVPIGGMTTGQISNLYPNLFVPAGLTFSIWGVIYLLLAVFVVFGMIRSIGTKKESSAFLDRIGLLFITTCMANVGWIFAWHFRMLSVSLVLMLVLLASLILMYIRLDIGRSDSSTAEKAMVHSPMSIYLGWISIATIANVTVLLVHYQWNGFGISQSAWTMVMIAAGTALGLTALFHRGDIFFASTIDWAVIGILIKHLSAGGRSTKGIIITAAAGIGLLSLGAIVQILRRKVYRCG